MSKKYKFNNEKSSFIWRFFFSNVCANKKIKERKDINNVFVVPNMGDGGLVLGGIYSSFESTKKKIFLENSRQCFFW